MSDRKKEGRGRGSSSGKSSPGRPSASSLTDAVVAALAQVEASSPGTGSPGTGSPGTGSSGASARAPVTPAASLAPDEKTAILGGVGERAVEASPAAVAAVVALPAQEVASPPAEVLLVRDDDDEPAKPPEPAAASESAPAASESAPAASESAPAASQPAAAASEPAAAKPTRPHEEVTAEHVVSGGEEVAKDGKGTEPPPASVYASIADGRNEETTARRAAVPAEQSAGIQVAYFGRTDVGLVREHNEDNFVVVELTKQQRGVDSAILHTTIGANGAVFAVCDGMGGAAAGEVASQMAVDTVHEMLQAAGPPRDRDHFARRLVRAVEEAGSRIFSSAKLDRSRRGMGTTATVAGLVDHMLFVGQVGDSRAYVLRGDQFALITKDQSLVNQLIEAGQLTEEEAEAFEHSNIILQALGTTEEVTVDLTFLELRRGDRLLMCSDGLSGLVHGDMMKEVLRGSRDLIDAANQLIAMANAGGGHDNITVVLAEFNGLDLKETSPDARVAYQQYPLPPEDPKDPDPAPRSVSIKSGGPKPGHDVKREPASVRPAALSTPGESGAGNSWFLVGVLLLVLTLLSIAIWLFLDNGSRSDLERVPASTSLALVTTADGSPSRLDAPVRAGPHSV